MQTTRQSQRGAYLIVASVLMVVLVGFGALALDVGRLFVLRSQMQNALDAAALAAAAELSRNVGAQARAEAAARNVLEYESGFAEVADLLGVNLATPEFFCAISSAFDPTDSAVTSTFCTQTAVVQNGVTRWPAAGDVDSHYVRLTMDQSVDGDAYSIPLFFLPVLGMFGLNVDTQSFLQAQAVAGRNYLYCDYPPLMMCNPFEGAGQRFQDVMNAGEQVLLADQGPGSNWVPGDVGFLALLGTTGADAQADFLANEGSLGCTTPVLTTEPGQMTQRTRRAINTRFDQYYNPGFANSHAANPPAPDVIDYPNDATFRASPADRFGNGDWDRTTYWNTYHAWQAWGPSFPAGPPGYATMTRFEMYEWELDNSYLPSRDPLVAPGNTDDTDYDGIPDPSHVSSGSVRERRVFNVAVVNCGARSMSGRSTFTLFGPEGFAKIFLTEAAAGPPNRQIWGEYIEWAQPGADSNILVDVQLYE